MADEVETFLKYVLERSEEINGGAHHESRGENFLNELLLHVDLLGNTVRFLHEIGNTGILSLDHQDKTKWKDLENVYFEVEKEFARLYNQFGHSSFGAFVHIY